MKEQLLKLENGIELNVRYSEEGEKGTVLLLHFGSGNSHIWDGILPFFAGDYRVIAPDLRGHGSSEKPAAGYHIDDMAEDVFYLLQKLNVDSCHLIGSSLGAEVGVSLASAHPELISSMICEGALYNEFGQYGLFQGSEKEIEEEIERRRKEYGQRTEEFYDSRDEAAAAQEKYFKEHGLWNRYVKGFIENNICQRENGRYASCYSLSVARQYMEHYWYYQFDKYYQRISCPVLFLPSEEESKSKKIYSTMMQFAEMVGSYEIKEIKGAMHAYLWMQYSVVAGKTALEFIEKQNK